MKKLQYAGLAGLALTLAVFLAQRFWLAPPDWAVRATGGALLLFLFLTVFSAVKAASRRGR